MEYQSHNEFERGDRVGSMGKQVLVLQKVTSRQTKKKKKGSFASFGSKGFIKLHHKYETEKNLNGTLRKAPISLYIQQS